MKLPMVGPSSTSALTLEVDRAPFRIRLKDAAGDRSVPRRTKESRHPGRLPTISRRGTVADCAGEAGSKPDEALFGSASIRRPESARSGICIVDRRAFGVRSDRAYKNVPL